jgi:hypothetical protein
MKPLSFVVALLGASIIAPFADDAAAKEVAQGYPR